MSNVVALPSSPPSYDAKTLALIRRTVAADTNDDEFNLFAHTARHLRLDPLRRQVFAIVHNKDKPDKRKLTIITAIDGLRSIADRTGAYRPDEEEPTYDTDAALKNTNNPAGLIKATVRVYKHSHGAWFKVTASAYWEEYAPLRDEWAENRETGRRGPTGNKTLDTSGQWGKMPRLMLAKVAEALAIRKAWPDDLSNVYVVEEIDRTRVADMLPSEAAAEGAAQDRMERIGAGKTILTSWEPMDALEPVPVGVFADKAVAFILNHIDEPSAIRGWQIRNREGLKQFWAHAPGDALEVKKAIEKALAADAAAP